jgi:hypothetical protein
MFLALSTEPCFHGNGPHDDADCQNAEFAHNLPGSLRRTRTPPRKAGSQGDLGMSRTVVVTGSTSGIGLGVAKAFAAEGANVVINGFGPADAIEAARRELDALGTGTVLYHGADMTRPAEIEDLIATAAKTFGTVDVLVNNAGIQHVAKIEEFPPENGTS